MDNNEVFNEELLKEEYNEAMKRIMDEYSHICDSCECFSCTGCEMARMME